jgi:peptide/nickel transport system substrate-binding protein
VQSIRHAIAAFSAAIVLVTATTPARAAAPHVLTFADGLDLTELNPLRPEAAPNVELNYLTMAFLTRYGEHGLQPELAAVLPTTRNGGISADGKTITFKLRAGLKWSDGAPLTAADVAFTVATIKDAKVNSEFPSTFAEVARVDALDASTAVFHLTKPHGQALEDYFSSRSAAILPRHLLAGVDVNTAPFMELPVGAGPFRYTKWVRGDRVELERNPYYALGTPKLAGIIYKMIPTETGTITALRTGEIDVALSATYPDYVPVANDPSIKVITRVGVRPSRLTFNVTRPALAEVAVRQALRMAIDRNSILKRSYLGAGVLAETMADAGDPDVAHIPLVAFDAAGANALLDRAGWKRGADGIRAKNGVRLAVEIIGGAGSSYVDQILELTRENWSAIGVDVTTKRYPLSLMFAPAEAGGIMFGGKFDVALFSYGEQSAADAAGPDCKDLPPNGANFGRFCVRSFQALIDQAEATYDPAIAGKLYREIQVNQAELVPFIVLVMRNELWLYRSNVTGAALYPFASFYDPMTIDVTK